MTNRPAGTSPKVIARIAGWLYLVVIAGGIFEELFVRSALIVRGDAAATATNILAHEMLYRFGFAAAILTLLINVPLTLIFYDLFQVVNRRLARHMVFFAVLGTAVQAVNLLAHFAPLVLLKGAPYLGAFDVEQLQALAYASLRLQSTGYDIALAFFAFYCLTAGYLIFKSTFLPRLLGALLALGGLCYVTNSFAGFLFPGFRAALLPTILVPSGVAELSLSLWLIVAGVNLSRWEKKASGGLVGGSAP
jgi:hypothetical protein